MPSKTLRRWPSRRFWVFTLALCAIVPVVAWFRRPAPRLPAKPYRFPSAELAALDTALQARFAVVPDSDFGLGRVGPRHGYFYPALASEKAAIKGLQDKQQEVVFYVVGRFAILKMRNARTFTPVQGPVYITPKYPLETTPHVTKYTQARFLSDKGVAKDAPSDAELIALSRSVFHDDTLRNGTDKTIGKWKVVARPIAASSPSCVDCHNAQIAWNPGTPEHRINPRRDILLWRGNIDKVALGDTLGIALYCYRPAGNTITKTLTEDELLAQPNQ